MSEVEKKTKNVGILNIKIKIPAVDDGIAMAKNFVDKLIMPSIEETGLLVKDFITAFRLKNQVKTLNNAKAICEAKGINPKMISLKLLVPLLDGAGLEEDDFLQEKWALLLTNMVDSKQNIDNHVFPYILSQISKDEFQFMENTLSKREVTRKELELIRK